MRVWVIGGTSGIGSAIVYDLIESGYEVVFTYQRAKETADKLEASTNGLARAVHLDLENDDDIENISKEISDDVSIYGIIFCAAIKYDTLLATSADEMIDKVFKINVLSAMRIIRAAVRPMTRNRDGRVILISSLAAKRNSRGNSIYASTKGALESFCKALANEVGPRGVTINCIAPGFIETNMMDGYSNKLTETLARLPARRLGVAKDVSAAVPFLLSDGAKYINGSVVAIDGGADCSI